MSGPVELHPLRLADLDAVHALWSDLETVLRTNWAHTPTREESAARLEKVIAFYGGEPRHFGPFTITIDGDVLGMIGADLRDAERGEHEVWYILRRDVWGRGIGGRALDALLARVIASGRVRRLSATAVTSNEPSFRLLERHGFVRTGTIAGGHKKHGAELDLFEYARVLVGAAGADEPSR